MIMTQVKKQNFGSYILQLLSIIGDYGKHACMIFMWAEYFISHKIIR